MAKLNSNLGLEVKKFRTTGNILMTLVVLLFLTNCSASKGQKQGKADKVLNVAQSYIGTPYKWGGTSRSGMDCSGLVCTAYSSVGMKLPRTVVDQAKLGREVSMGSLRKGDLVIFRIKRKKKGRVWHTGIVKEVVSKNEILFVHASSSKGVTVSNLMSDYYQKWFKQARRLL